MTPPQQEQFDLANSFFGGFMYPSPLITISFEGQDVLIKRDDLLQLGCSKQRSIPLMIYHHMQSGSKKFVVSSSGNAALISAFCAMQTSSIEMMQIYLADTISDTKLQKFIDYLDLDSEIEDLREEGFSMDNLKIDIVQDPRQKAFDLGKLGFVNLRGSTDDSAITGFQSISQEIMDQTGSDIDAIFVPASSGTTAAGIYNGFVTNNLNPQMHIVQTSKVHSLLKRVVPESFMYNESSNPAESIVDIVGHRRTQIEDILKDSLGYPWIVTSSEVAAAKSELEEYGIYVSYDSALSFAAFKKSREVLILKKPVLIFTG